MLDSLNIGLFRIINDAHSPFFDAVIGIVSGLGDGLVIALCCAVLMPYRFRLGMAATVAFFIVVKKGSCREKGVGSCFAHFEFNKNKRDAL